ncbi:MAG: YceI family protein [Candidatus Nanopelagicales bacterium]
METVTITPTNGDLHILTTAEGAASRAGHDLVIDVDDFRATVVLDGEQPTEVHLVAALTSLRVLSGAGGLKPLTAGDKSQIIRNAVKALKADETSGVLFAATEIVGTADGYELTGTVTIGEVNQPLIAVVTVLEGDDRWTVSSTVELRQSDFGITPYSAMFGTLKVADLVRVKFDAAIGK